jgi:hypothetical protein
MIIPKATIDSMPIHSEHDLAATTLTFFTLCSSEFTEEQAMIYLGSVQSCADAYIRSVKFLRLTP